MLLLTHPVLCQGSGFVRADSRSRSWRKGEFYIFVTSSQHHRSFLILFIMAISCINLHNFFLKYLINISHPTYQVFQQLPSS